MAGTQALAEYDTNGVVVPVWKPKAYTHNGSNQVLTITVVDTLPNASGIAVTWVKTFAYSGGNIATDSGWVRQ